MASKRSIKAKDIVVDIRGGMTDSELMIKYKLSIKGLQSIFRKLEENKVLRPSELYGRQNLEADTVNLEQFRAELREYLSVPLAIYEVQNPQTRGVVSDLSTHGVRVRGLQAKVGETKTLRIHPQQFLHVNPFDLRAICRWVKREGENRDYVAGFEITSLEEDALTSLEEIIRKQRLPG